MIGGVNLDNARKTNPNGWSEWDLHPEHLLVIIIIIIIIIII